MQDMKTGEGGLLQVTLEGINLKFMHNQVGGGGSPRLPAPVLPAEVGISVQVPKDLLPSERERGPLGQLEQLDPRDSKGRAQ